MSIENCVGKVSVHQVTSHCTPCCTSRDQYETVQNLTVWQRTRGPWIELIGASLEGMSSMVSPGKTCTRGQHTCSISESQWLLRGSVDSRQMLLSALASECDAATSGKTRAQGLGA